MRAVAKACWFRCVVDQGFEGALLLAVTLTKVRERQPNLLKVHDRDYEANNQHPKDNQL